MKTRHTMTLRGGRMVVAPAAPKTAEDPVPVAEHAPDVSMAARTLGRAGGKSRSERKTAGSRENGRKGGRPKGRPPRSFGEGFLGTPKGYYCMDCGKWVPWSKESRYSTGAEIRTVCIVCYGEHEN